jgi:TolA-binding protein
LLDTCSTAGVVQFEAESLGKLKHNVRVALERSDRIENPRHEERPQLAVRSQGSEDVKESRTQIRQLQIKIDALELELHSAKEQTSSKSKDLEELRGFVRTMNQKSKGQGNVKKR